MTTSTKLECACGHLALEVTGEPILNAECCCNSCRTAAAKLRALPRAAPFPEPGLGTRFVLYRKDRVSFVQGVDMLKEFRLGPDATTRRVLATCCNTPVFLEFEKGHWLSLYGCLWPADKLPPLEMRTMTSDLPAGTVLPADVPNGARQPLTFMLKLLGAWMAMFFRSPEITVVNGVIHV